MTYKVCILCDQIIEEKDRVDYDVFASYYKYDKDGIYDTVEKPVILYFHLKCFTRYKKNEKKMDLYFTQEVYSKRLVIKSGITHEIWPKE